MKRRIAYEGSEFTIEWYCDSKGHSPALEYFDEQPKDKQLKLLNLFRLMENKARFSMKQSLEMKGTEFMLLSPNLIVIYVFSLRARKLL